jgi:hypothetical protein
MLAIVRSLASIQDAGDASGLGRRMLFARRPIRDVAADAVSDDRDEVM